MSDDPTVPVPLSHLRRIQNGADAAYAVAERVSRSAPGIEGVNDADLATMRLGILIAGHEARRLIRDEDARRAAMFPGTV